MKGDGMHDFYDDDDDAGATCAFVECTEHRDLCNKRILVSYSLR